MAGERDKSGRFVVGHESYRNGGRKPREAERRYLDLLRKCVSESDATAIVQAAIDQAKKRDGHMERKWLFDYLAGPPVQRIAPTDPTGEYEYTGGLSDDELVRRAAAIVTQRASDSEQVGDDVEAGRPPEPAPPPGNWLTWLILAGRGWGKTRTGAEWVRPKLRAANVGAWLVGKTPGDVRDVMIEGEAGLLAISPTRERPEWNPSIRRLTWPNGAIATTYSSFNYEELRGPAHDGAWCDEPCKWKYPQETWDTLMFGLRVGTAPRVVVTTTPKPIRWLKNLLRDATTVVTRGTTYENLHNLAAPFKKQILERYEGTRLGRQELNAEMLEDAEGAPWKRADIEAAHVAVMPQLVRVVVGVDPAGSSKAESDEVGIVGAGLGVDGHGYVLGDSSLRATPEAWARAAVALYSTLKADRIVAEGNFGGEMVASTLRVVSPNVPVRMVSASRGKAVRVEPISALYEQHRVHHVGTFGDLEDQMCQWVPGEGKSPDRVDALVWALTDLMQMSIEGPLMV